MQQKVICITNPDTPIDDTIIETRLSPYFLQGWYISQISASSVLAPEEIKQRYVVWYHLYVLLQRDTPVTYPSNDELVNELR